MTNTKNMLMVNSESEYAGMGKQYISRYLHQDGDNYYLKMTPFGGSWTMNHVEFNIPEDGIVFSSKNKNDVINVAKTIFLLRFTKYKRKTEKGKVLYRNECMTITHSTWQRVRDALTPLRPNQKPRKLKRKND